MKECLPRGMRTSPKGKKNHLSLFGTMTKKQQEATNFIPLNKHEQILYGHKFSTKPDQKPAVRVPIHIMQAEQLVMQQSFSPSGQGFHHPQPIQESSDCPSSSFRIIGENGKFSNLDSHNDDKTQQP